MMKLNLRKTERVWVFGGIAAIVLIAFVGWTMFVSPARDNTAQAQAETSTAQAHDALLQQRLDELASENKNLPSYEANLARAQAALPTGDGLPNFLRSLQSLGNATLVTVTQMSVAPPVAAAQPGTAASTAATDTPSTGPTAVAQASAYSIPITLTATGTTAHLSEFLAQLQEVQPRAVLVTQASLGTDTSTGTGTGGGSASSQTTLQLTMNAFVAAPTPVATAPAATATPSAAPTS